jgi:hypothetical protein
MARKRSQALLSRNESRSPRLRVISGVVGALLLALAGIWLAWQLLHQFAGQAIPAPPIIGVAPTNPAVTQIAPLTTEGIILSHPDKTPGLSQQQALLIAGQLEPNAVSKAKVTSAQYVLLNYPNKSTPATHTDIINVPAWMILYRGIPLQPADAAVDPAPFTHPSYDLYVFLDANSGKELLTIQV